MGVLELVLLAPGVGDLNFMDSIRHKKCCFRNGWQHEFLPFGDL